MIGANRYEMTRYAHLDQKLVDKREQGIVKQILSKLDHPNILDMPCGYGRFTHILLSKGAHLVSADLSRREVMRCRERTPSDRCGFVVADIQNLPFKEDSFALVFTLRLFQHISPQERERAFYELARVSRRWAIISFYSRSLPHRLARKIKGLKSRIKMLPGRGFLEEGRKHHLIVRGVLKLFPFIHAQSVVLFEKKATA